MISIVIPTKNNGDVLERCLSSIEGLDCHAGVAERLGAGVQASEAGLDCQDTGW